MKIEQQRIDRSSWDEIHIEGWFKALIPPSWEVEEDGEVLIFDPDGFGELNVNLLVNEDKVGKKQKASNIISDWADELGWHNGFDISLFKRNRDLLIACAELTSEEPEGEVVFWRLFPVVGEKITLDISYSCPVEDRDREEAVIEGIIDSIQLVGTGGSSETHSETSPQRKKQ